jgi:hypothetical protein
LSSPTDLPQHEIHRYRKLVARTSWIVIATGCLYLLASILVALYQQRNAVVGDRVSVQLTQAEIAGCYDELHDVSAALEKHLENAYHLLGVHDAEEAQRWLDEGEMWRKRWHVLGARCRLADRLPGAPNKDMAAMAAAHQELGNIQTTYSHELLRFGNELAPRLERIYRDVRQIGEHLSGSASPTGAPNE